MPVLTFPLMLLGLASLPALAAIYWLRNRFRRQPVSSLMLWLDHHSPREGGMRMQRLTTPLLFFLELASLALLALAATEPRILMQDSHSTLVLVLDDSFSMQAVHNGRTCHERAMEFVRQVTRAERHLNARVVLAGPIPASVGHNIRNATELADALSQWQCRQPAAAIENAISLAAEIGGPRSRILVVTDHAPPMTIDAGPTKWHAFGHPTNNHAIVTAVRKPGISSDRVLLELVNLSVRPTTATFTVRNVGTSTSRQASPRTLGPGETYRTSFNLEPNAPAIEILIDEDALDIDNRVVLQSMEPPKVAVHLAISDEELATRIRRALEATQRTQFVTAGADLLVTDDVTRTTEGERTWPVYLWNDATDAQSWASPFVVDHTHPLATGLALSSVIWGTPGVDQAPALPGSVIVATASTTLVSAAAQGNGSRHDIHMAIVPDNSTFLDSPNWPVFWWNLISWRASALPGLHQPNVRLGDDVILRTESTEEPFTVVTPSGEVRTAPAHERQVVVVADQVGDWQIQHVSKSWSFAVNALNRAESDLRECVSGVWGDWLSDPTLRRQYADTSWILLGCAALLLTAHLFAIARSSRPGGPA